MATRTQIKIDAGPNKEDLKTAFFDHSNAKPQYLTFNPHRNDATRVKVLVTNIRREDGSGNIWLLDGYVINAQGGTAEQFNAVYHTNMPRHGTLTIK